MGTGPAPTLLIVDDMAVNRALLARRFAQQGFQIIEAQSGSEALDLIGQSAPALVLLDTVMPGLSGIDVLKKLRQQYDPMQLPVIMVTGKSEGSDVAAALEAGANDYVIKPVDFAAALARVKAQLDRKKANDTLRGSNEILEERIVERMADLVRTNEQLKKEIAEREGTQAEIHYLAHHDSLTGIANRTLLRQQLQQALSHPGRGNVQGFLISSPRPAHEIPAMIRSLTSLSDGNISPFPHRGASGMRAIGRMSG